MYGGRETVVAGSTGHTVLTVRQHSVLGSTPDLLSLMLPRTTSQGITLPTFRVGLPIISKIPHRLVSLVNLNPITGTMILY